MGSTSPRKGHVFGANFSGKHLAHAEIQKGPNGHSHPVLPMQCKLRGGAKSKRRTTRPSRGRYDSANTRTTSVFAMRISSVSPSSLWPCVHHFSSRRTMPPAANSDAAASVTAVSPRALNVSR